MLAGRTSRVSRGRISSIAAAITRPPLPSHSVYSALFSATRHLTKSTMFRRAVDAHVASEKTSNSLEKQLFPSSSPATQITLDAQAQTRVQPSGASAPLGKPLRSTPPNKLNASAQKPFHPPSSVKRTASGLAKALGNQDHDGFQTHPVMSSKSSDRELYKTHPPKQEAVVLFDDDFDSDIELEVENPSTRATVSYPKLPVTYPTLPQKAQFHTHASSNPTYEDFAQPASSQAPPPSAQPLPWSSSPDFHKQPPPKRSAPLTEIHYHGDQESLQATDPPTEPHPRPPKRRVLPWTKDEESEGHIDSHPAQDSSNARLETAKTPMSKLASAFPWNSTASAIKEQQKQLRKATKKSKEEPPAEQTELVKVNARKAKGVARPHLSREQRHVLDLVVEHGKSVFFTGSAGTGKSVLLREIISVLRKQYLKETDRVAVTASTGLAACNIGGVTLHSFAGIGLGKEEVPELVKKIKRNQKARHRWMRTKVLIVDEVSMVDGELFDKLEAIARHLRNNARPFGGIQLVITGDFFQLPPVPDYSNRMATFAFDAKQWRSAIHHTIGLHHVFRQKDAVFANMLNEMREGHLSPHSIETFRSLSRPLTSQVGDEREATELFPTRAEVEAANNTRMRQLSGATMVYEAKDGGAIFDKVQRDKLLANCMAPQELVLKKGAQVMLIKNIDEHLVNGSLGRVHSFMTEDMFNKYDGNPGLFSSSGPGDEEAANAQWTKDRLALDALKASTGQLWPMVRFMNADGTTRDLLCTREAWKVELPNGEVQACRNQVPLILAWALSIHKAQGQTLEKVKVDLGKVFEKGQAYVALSRATSIDGLQVLRFDPGKVKAHERVRSFYSSLSVTEEENER